MKYRVSVSKKVNTKVDSQAIKNDNTTKGTCAYTVGGRTYSQNELEEKRKSYVGETKPFESSSSDNKSANKKPSVTNSSFNASELTRNSNQHGFEKKYSKNGAYSSMGRSAVNTTQKAVSQNDDMGGAIVGTMIGSAVLSATYFKTVQKAVPVSIKAFKTTIKPIKNVPQTARNAKNKVKTAVVRVSKNFKYVKKMKPRRLVKRFKVKTKNKVKTAVVRVRKNFKYVKTMKPRRLVSQVAKKTKNKAIKVIKTEVKKTGARTKSLGKWTVKSGIPKAIKGIDKASLSVAGAMTSADDSTVQGVGYIATATNYGVKTSATVVKTTGKTINTTVKKTAKVTKLTAKTIKSIWKDGFKKTWQKIARTTKTAVAKGSKSLVSSAVSGLKKVGLKLVIPLALCIVIISAVATAISGGASVIAHYLSGEFLFDNGDGTYTTMDIKRFLENEEYGVPAGRFSHLNYVYIYTQSQLKNYAGTYMPFGSREYDRVEFRIHTDHRMHDVTNKDSAKFLIDNVFYTEPELVEAVQAIFYAVILEEYDLEPDEDEALEAFEDIWSTLFYHSKSERTVYCAGEEHSCGVAHSQYNCYNPIFVVHKKFTCETCCHYICKGHPKLLCTMRDSEGHICSYSCKYENVVTLCEGCEFVCEGGEFCGGHKICEVVWNLRGSEDYFEEYFEEPIRELEKKSNRSDEEEKQLQQLKTYYEIALAYSDSY